jgi:hypothetical protein
MSVRILALGLVGSAILGAQAKHMSWENLCFKNPGAPVCQGNDYAIKPPPGAKPSAKNDPAARTVTTNPSASTPGTAAASMVVVGGIDWRFADPFADALVGINFSGLSASPLARGLIAQLGTAQGLTDADMQKIFDGLAGVDQVAVSVRNNRMVVMITGRATESALPEPEAGLKTVSVSGGALLVGHPEAVDQAAQRIAMKGPLTDLTRSAAERQSSSELWAVGSAALLGPQAASSGVKRFWLTVFLHDSLTSDVALEFNAAPSAEALQTWRTALGGGTLEGNVVRLRTSLEASEVRQKFGPIAASPAGQQLGALVQAARYLPVPDATRPKPARPVIYGLDDKPRILNQ